MAEKEIVVEPAAQDPEDKASRHTERWWSSSDHSHMIMIQVDGEPTYVKFERYALEIDLRKEIQLPNGKVCKGSVISKALHMCGREGRDIFVVGTKYPGSEVGQRTDILRRLRSIAQEQDGTNKIRGLFSYKELVDGGISPHTNDVDEMIMLALRTKSVKEIGK